MPIDKDQAARFREINRLLNLRKGSVVSTGELMRACNISLRTLRNDIAQMRLEEAPIESKKPGGGYYYSEPYDLPSNLALSATDMSRLKMAAAIFAQFRHLEIFQGFEETVEKIQSSVERWVRAKSSAKSIFFEPITFYSGTELIPIFLNAIEFGKTVSFEYHSYKSPEIRNHKIYPYFLQEFSHRWYVVGWSPLYQTIMPFALERIHGQPEILSSDPGIPKDFNRDEYFKNTYGMTRYSEAEVVEVVLSFSPLQALYFKSKPFHKYSLVSESNKGLVVKMNLVVNYELKRKIISMGPEVKVLQPANLVEDIKKLHQDSLMQYESP